jgi:uncharacterized protein YjbI with pentapeptide repeats
MAPSESSQPRQKEARPLYEWIVAGTLVVTSLATAAALYFSRQSIQATNSQLQISEQGQITDRYNAAIANLGSRSIDIRLGGIYALQRLMQDSARDQPTIVAVLCAFVRDRTISTLNPYKRPPLPPTDIQAALTVVGTRNAADDGPATVVDFGYTQLARAQLDHDNLTRAKLTWVDLTGANLTHANLTGANLTGAHLSHANLTGADLTHANLDSADFTRAILNKAHLTRAYLAVGQLAGAYLTGAGLTRADLQDANLTRADLTGAHLTGAHLTGAHLAGADLTGADLTYADLTYAHFTGSALPCPNLSCPNLPHANLTHANLTGALWPADAAVPKGWLRDAHSGRLKRPST